MWSLSSEEGILIGIVNKDTETKQRLELGSDVSRITMRTLDTDHACDALTTDLIVRAVE